LSSGRVTGHGIPIVEFGNQLRQQPGEVTVGAMTEGAPLTIFVVPAVYMLFAGKRMTTGITTLSAGGQRVFAKSVAGPGAAGAGGRPKGGQAG
jgi:hypothetical protein